MTMSMVTSMAIALHRYKMIVGLQRSGGETRPLIVICLTWIASLIPACIFLYVMVLMPIYHPKYNNIYLYNICIEVWPFKWGGETWTGFTILEQYVAPLLTISIVHFRIIKFIDRNRMNRKHALRMDKENKRHRKTTVLLVTVTVSYMLCWAPYHIFHTLRSYTDVFRGRTNLLYMLFGLVHMLAMCSAICNPCIYGFMNDNLRAAILSLCRDVLCIKKNMDSCDTVADKRTTGQHTKSTAL